MILEKEHKPREGTELMLYTRMTLFYQAGKKNINPVRGRKQCQLFLHCSFYFFEKEHKPREGTETADPLRCMRGIYQLEKEHKPREGTVYTRSRKGDVYEFCLYY